MRNYKRDLLTILLAAYGVGFIADAAYGGVAFIGDENKVGFGAAKKVIPTIFTCPDGQAWYKGKCEKKCDRTAFSLTGTPDEVKGTFDTCTDAWGTYYVYKSCHNGWDLIDGDCKETDCTGFPYTTAPESIAGTVTSCKSGTKMFYKYLSCNEGWDLSNGKCTVHTCSSTTYPYTSKPTSDAGTVISCKTGVAIQYGYSDCRTGWDKNNGYCNIHVCDNNAFPFTSQPSNSIGTVASCKTGNDVKYGYSACSDDYDLINGQCETKCTLTATSKPTGCATATDSCAKNGTTYYASTCASCSSGYTLSGGSCTANTCSGYTQTTSSISHCSTTASCTKPSGTVYACSRCQTGYSLMNGACCNWDGYGFASCPSNCNCRSHTCGGQTRYAISSAKSGYVVSCNRCVIGGVHSCNSSSTAVGDIYYSDNTCSSEIITGKTPIGVVFDTKRKLVVALDYANKPWNDGAQSYSDIPTLTNYTTRDAASNDFNGKNNTDKIVAFAASSGRAHQAAQYCHDRTIGGKTWYLPALGELYSIYPNLATINPMLVCTNGKQFEVSSTYSWTSTEYGGRNGYSYAWIIHMSEAWLDRMNQLPIYAYMTRCIFAY